jgi:hypothetical protein
MEGKREEIIRKWERTDTIFAKDTVDSEGIGRSNVIVVTKRGEYRNRFKVEIDLNTGLREPHNYASFELKRERIEDLIAFLSSVLEATPEDA